MTELIKTLEKALSETFPNLRVEQTKHTSVFPFAQQCLHNSITLMIDLKPLRDVPGMPDFKRELWFAEVRLEDNDENILVMVTKTCSSSNAHRYPLSDPDSLNKVYSILHCHYKDVRQLLGDKQIMMIPVGKEPTDSQLLADTHRIAVLRKEIPLLEWNFNKKII